MESFWVRDKFWTIADIERWFLYCIWCAGRILKKLRRTLESAPTKQPSDGNLDQLPGNSFLTGGDTPLGKSVVDGASAAKLNGCS